MTWKESVRQQLIQFQSEEGDPQFSLHEFYEFAESDLQKEYPDNNHVRAKIRQVLQRLRDDGEIEFIDNHGRYRMDSEEESTEQEDPETEISILDELEEDLSEV